jgi:lysine 2,3-aminomutase
LEIIQGLRGHISGLAIPHFVIDSPGGGGKIPLLPHYIEKLDDKEVVMRNFKGERYTYPQVQDNLEPTIETLKTIATQNGFQLGAEIQDYF